MKPTPRACTLLAVLLACTSLASGPADAARRRPVRHPNPAAATKATPRPPGRATIGRPKYDASERLLVVPYKGDEPAYTRGVLRLPPRVVFDFDADAPGLPLVNEVVFSHPSWLGWSLAPRGGKGGHARVTLVLKRAVTVTVVVDAKRHALLLIPAGAPDQPPTPAPRKPSAVPESTPAPVKSPTPTPTPALPSPLPSPSPVAHPSLTPMPATPTPKPTMPPPRPTVAPVRQATAGGPRLAVELPLLAYDQASPAQHVDGVLMPGLHADIPMGIPLGASAWSLGLDGRYLAPAYLDAAGALHARQEGWLAATALTRLPLGAVDLEGGLGWAVRLQNNVSAPGAFWHGPALHAGLNLPVIDGSGWAVRVGGGLMPYLVSSAGPTWGHELAVAFEVPLGNLALDVGYRRFGVGGEVFQGPYVSLITPR
ncbi:MAG: hypothetical protein JWM80_3985 [Cyanobacteria bacterium RYN_339]|nr:hypothetical protein [Cyanobacteria bacterium RYN_339]